MPAIKWVAEWVPFSGRGSGCRRRQSYWVRELSNELSQVLLGSRGIPPNRGRAHFYINGDRVYRDEGHPDGASSVPYFTIRGRRVYPSEGFPTGAASVPLFRIRPWRDEEKPVRIRINTRRDQDPD